MSEDERVEFLVRLHRGDSPHLGAELRRRCAREVPRGDTRVETKCWTAGEVRLAAGRIADARKQRAAEQAEIEQRRRAEMVAVDRKRRLDELAKRGEAAWREVEALIVQRNTSGYDQATALLVDLRDLAARGAQADSTARRIAYLVERHYKKGQFNRRLKAVGLA